MQIGGISKERETERETERERHTDRQTDRQTDTEIGVGGMNAENSVTTFHILF